MRASASVSCPYLYIDGGLIDIFLRSVEKLVGEVFVVESRAVGAPKVEIFVVPGSAVCGDRCASAWRLLLAAEDQSFRLSYFASVAELWLHFLAALPLSVLIIRKPDESHNAHASMAARFACACLTSAALACASV